MRASGAQAVFRRVRARALGPLFLVVACVWLGVACSPPDAHTLAARADRADGTGLYTWLVDHDPSALVAWHVSPERLQPLAPDAHPVAPAGPRPCAQTIRLHAALVLVASDQTAVGRRDRDVALDCGIPLFRDRGGMVIAPR